MVVFISACIIWFDLHNSGGGGGLKLEGGNPSAPPPPPLYATMMVTFLDGGIIIAEHTWSYTHHLVDVYIIFVKNYPIYVFG